MLSLFVCRLGLLASPDDVNNANINRSAVKGFRMEQAPVDRTHGQQERYYDRNGSSFAVNF